MDSSLCGPVVAGIWSTARDFQLRAGITSLYNLLAASFESNILACLHAIMGARKDSHRFGPTCPLRYTSPAASAAIVDVDFLLARSKS